MRDRIAQVLGIDPFSIEGTDKLTIPTLELLTNDLYADESLLMAAQSAMAQQNASDRHDGSDPS